MQFEIPRSTIRGIVDNPAATADVLLRLLAEEASDVWNYLAWRRLPTEVIDALLEHPSERLRSSFAENTYVRAEERARLINDPSLCVRRSLANGPDWFRIESPPLPEWAQLQLINDVDSRVVALALDSRNTSLPVPAGLAGDGDPLKRHAACRAWALLDADTRATLRTDPDDKVRTAAARAASPEDPDAADDYLAATAGEETLWERSSMIRRAALHPATARRLAAGDDTAARAAVAGNPRVPVDLLRHLAADPEHRVRLHFAFRPDLSEQERARFGLQQHPNFPRTTLPERFAGDPDKQKRWLINQDKTAPAETVLALSRDPDVSIRRSSAGHPNLPVARLLELIEDPDLSIARSAAQNSSLPPDAMHRLLDRAGIPRRD